MGTLLPVVAAWVGTVLAFYFGRENFEAATKSVTAVAREIARGDERLKEIPARDKMRLLKDITYHSMKPGEEANHKISDILQKFARVDRIPILDDKGRITYLVYKNVLNQLLGQLALDPTKFGNKRAADLTFKDILDSDPKLKEQFSKSIGFVAEGATLADAKREMERVSKTTPCNDVFVTQTGQPTEPILGWITDNKIAESSKV
jgi:hypothetical protein